eukprot:CAMPEP_0117490540 /NCGR_PEP_ID=MMETSP0784-20121206/17603_1 /TAXON_ID=39447 /ORGANISM="" /LENGTH=393 /DNA_ID=CAMNT_0005285301 /DNA_START=14 /DNA_END=1196 /DNA_ORIENTATION=+
MAALVACPYAVLGLWPGASVEDAKAAFRRAALRTHPDKPGGSAESFKAVQLAYEKLLGTCDLERHVSSQPSAGNVFPSHAFAGGGMGRAQNGSTAEAPEASAAPTFEGWDGVPAHGHWSSGAAVFDPWGNDGAAAFDPWNSTAVGAFDPWSCAAVAGVHCPNGGAFDAVPNHSVGSVGSVGGVVGAQSAAVGSFVGVAATPRLPEAVTPTAALGGGNATSGHKRRRTDDVNVITPWTDLRRKGENFACAGGANAGGKGKFSVLRENRNAGFGAVYGFREDSSEDEGEQGPAFVPVAGMSATAGASGKLATSACPLKGFLRSLAQARRRLVRLAARWLDTCRKQTRRANRNIIAFDMDASGSRAPSRTMVMGILCAGQAWSADETGGTLVSSSV